MWAHRSQGRPDPAPASRIITIGDRPGVRPTETSLAHSNSSRPREAENRERPKSTQPSNASSNPADRSQPASNQQTAPTWRDFPGSREAGSHQLHGIGPYKGRRPGLGLRPREIQNGNGQLATRHPFHGQQPGQLGRVKAPSGRLFGDPQTFGDGVQAPTIWPPVSTAEEPTGRRNVEAQTS